MSLAAAEINVTGSVQGVGFRYFCHTQARNLNLNGWVKNLSDGSVCSTVEGEKDSIEQYISLLKSGSGASSVAQVDINWQSYSGQFDRFEITY